MSKRLEFLAEKIKKPPPFVDSSFDYLNMSAFLTHEENVNTQSLRKPD